MAVSIFNTQEKDLIKSKLPGTFPADTAEYENAMNDISTLETEENIAIYHAVFDQYQEFDLSLDNNLKTRRDFILNSSKLLLEIDFRLFKITQGIRNTLVAITLLMLIFQSAFFIYKYRIRKC